MAPNRQENVPDLSTVYGACLGYAMEQARGLYSPSLPQTITESPLAVFLGLP